MNSFYPSPEINEIMSINENRICFDCGDSFPKWTSLNNAVFLCGKCAFFHKTLPPEISTVKSLETEVFSPSELLLLRTGGNARFKALLGEYQLLTETSEQEFKYILKISEYYRDLLQKEINRNNDPGALELAYANKPSLEEGITVIESIRKKLEQDSEHMEFSQDANGILGKIGYYLGVAGTNISNVAKTVAEKVGIDQSLINAKNAISENETFNYIGEKAKNFGQGVGDVFKSGYDKVMDTAVAKKLVQSAEHQYVNLKRKIQNRQGNENNNNNNMFEQDNINQPMSQVENNSGI